MDIDAQTLAWLAMGMGLVGMAWAIFWPLTPSTDMRPVSTHWEIVYVDEDGVMQLTMVRVLKVNPTSRRMTAWCARSGSERVFKLSKIVKATDARSGLRINLAHLIDAPRVVSHRVSTPERRAEDQVPTDIGSWWSTSRLGLH